MLMSCFLYTSKICCAGLSVSVLVLRVPHHPVSWHCCQGGPGGSTAPPLNCGYLSRIPFACLLPVLYAAWIFVLRYHFPLLFCTTYLFTVRIALLYIYSYQIRHFLFFIHLVLFFLIVKDLVKQRGCNKICIQRTKLETYLKIEIRLLVLASQRKEKKLHGHR